MPIITKLKNQLLSYQGTLFDLLFLAYLYFCRDSFLAELGQLDKARHMNYLIGSLMVGLIIIDLLGYWLKTPFVFARLRQENGGIDSKTSFFGIWEFYLWMGHALVTVIVFFLAATAFKFIHNQDLMFGLLLLVVIKELVILFIFFGLDGNEKTPPLKNRIREFWGSLALFIFSVFAYTISWEYLMLGDPVRIRDPNPVMTGLNLLCAIFIFAIFFMPLRMVYLFEEFHSKTGKWEWFIKIASILFTFIAAVKPLW